MKLQFNILLLLSFLIFNGSCQSIKKWISKNPSSSNKRSIASVNLWCSNYGKLHNKDRRVGMAKAVKDNASACIKHFISKDVKYMEALTDICRDKYGDARVGFFYVIEGNSSCVEYFFKKHKGYVNAFLNNGGTRALMAASNNLEMTQRLLDEGAKPNLRDARGRTALMYAVIDKNLKVVKELLRRKADPNLQDDQGNSAFILSVLNPHPSTHDDTIYIIRELIQAGAKPNLKNKRGHNALLAMAMSPRGRSHLFSQDLDFAPHQKEQRIFSSLADELYRSGVNFNAQDNEGKTLLIHLSQQRRDVLKHFKGLFKYDGIDPNIQDNLGRVALMHTARGIHIKASQFLLEQGADPNIQDNQGKRALEHIPSYGGVKGNKLRQILTKITEPGPYIKKYRGRGMRAKKP